jgi:hypothetical protein
MAEPGLTGDQPAVTSLGGTMVTCLEVDVASQGATIDEALANLAEAVELYLEELDDPARYVTSTPLVTSFQLPGAA